MAPARKSARKSATTKAAPAKRASKKSAAAKKTVSITSGTKKPPKSEKSARSTHKRKTA